MNETLLLIFASFYMMLPSVPTPPKLLLQPFYWLGVMMFKVSTSKVGTRAREESGNRRHIRRFIRRREREDIVGVVDPTKTPIKQLPQTFSEISAWPKDNKEKKLYIVLIRSGAPYTSVSRG